MSGYDGKLITGITDSGKKFSLVDNTIEEEYVFED